MTHVLLIFPLFFLPVSVYLVILRLLTKKTLCVASTGPIKSINLHPNSKETPCFNDFMWDAVVADFETNPAF